eukprot:146014-Prymnesium_polylepis.1
MRPGCPLGTQKALGDGTRMEYNRACGCDALPDGVRRYRAPAGPSRQSAVKPPRNRSLKPLGPAS